MKTCAHGRNVRKVKCPHGWQKWPKCPCGWYFVWTPPGGPRYRLSLDKIYERHIDSKTEAEDLAADLRKRIKAGTFDQNGPVVAPVAASITLDAFAALYLAPVQASGKASWEDDQYRLKTLQDARRDDGARLGGLPLSAITESDLEAFHAAQRAVGRANSTLNHYVQLLKTIFRWAVRKGYLGKSPISDETTLRRAKANQRRRRVPEEEEARLLHAADAQLRPVIVAALATAARQGELLALRWPDISWEKHTVFIRAVEKGAKKTGRSRVLPVSAKLHTTLESLTHTPHPPTFIFGELDKKLNADTLQKNWERTVLKANGVVPVWRNGSLIHDCRVALHEIDFHFHDLRHEAACRWLEAGWPLHHIQQMLGHTNIAQTSTYLHAGEGDLQESMRRYDKATTGQPEGQIR